MTREMLEACYTQAERLRVGMEKQMTEMFPEDDNTLVVTGFMFRPADSSDVDEDEDPEEQEIAPWTLEVHYTAPNHGFVSNTATKLGMMYDADTYEGACAQFIASVMAPGPKA